ncbi:MAG: MFS transporter [Acidobacteria bacterium]|nr:MFS transporter [Acidobacteriota bacterium]MCB9399088.1 MFS transporter [Acidobacteriota bacterium]
MQYPTDRLASKGFLAFTATQLLGAFNDNIYKQVMLLFALSVGTGAASGDKQGTITMVFSLPFILFSGYSGQLSEKYSKSWIMALSKYWELVIMVLGAVVFATGSFTGMLVVLFMMGAQSTLFGPSKYGALPELIQDQRLTAANGLVQMTTFVAIIMGTAIAGYLMDHFRSQLYLAGVVCSVVAVLGIGTVLAIPKLQANRPDTRLNWNPFGRVLVTVWNLKNDPILALVMVANCFFWFSGVMVVQIVNNYGKNLLNLKETQISLLLVSVSVGIMLGCLAAARIEKALRPAGTVFLGAVLIAVFQMSLYFYGMPFWSIHVVLVLAGAASGLYYVPLATLLQSRPPLGEKGEVLAAMNFLNFIAMFIAGFVWSFFIWTGLGVQWAWVLLGASMIVLILCLYPGFKKYL